MTDEAAADHPVCLLLTDIVDSAALAAQLGDAAMGQAWAAHDRIARDLLQRWHGREIDKTDGFLLLFGTAADGLAYALDYHRALAALVLPQQPGLRLQARAGLHVGRVTLRQTPAADVALGAKPVEVDGVSKPIAARVMSTALGGQTLLTRAALDALGTVAQRVVAHGHWRIKGLPAPLELFEAGEAGAPFVSPPDGDKAWRVVRQGGLWLPARELRHSLPAERDAFVGRRDALQDVQQRFDNGARVVSVLGIGGAGKTRLATRYGWAWLGDHPGGVWFCDLAPARTLDGLLSAVAQGLQVPLGIDDPVVQLGHAIAGRSTCLVVLDNFEQLARYAEATLGRWLERAPQARFLVTTREVLGIAGEETMALAPLAKADAETLFVRRAAAARDGFDADAAERAAIAPLVKLLDGLPLAIELAAARVRTLTPRAVLARMSERFKVLASAGGRLDRQATLRAAFDWSWDLLSAAEKAALAQLSVFEGGFTPDAAEAVIDLSQQPAPRPWTLDMVQALVDKSFVRALGGGRLDLLVSVQAYAAERLVEGSALLSTDDAPGPAADGVAALAVAEGGMALAAAQRRHCAWYARLGPQRAVDDACADIDNLVAACRRAVAAQQAELAAGALDGAWAALALRGPFNAGVELAAAVCALPALHGRAAAHAHAAWGAALEASGRPAAAAQQYEAALQHAGPAGDPKCEAKVLVDLAGLHAREGHVEHARTEHSRGLALARLIGDGRIECAAINGLGTADYEQGRMTQAQAHWDAALAVARRIGDRRWQGSMLGNLGNLHASLGRMAPARAHINEALAIARELGDRTREGNTLCNLGMLRSLQGEQADAGATLEDALVVARELGHARLECIVLGNLGMVYAASGRTADAVMRYDAALLVARRISDRRTEGQFLGHLGLANARLGDFDTARANLGNGAAILQDADDGMSLALLLCERAECEWLAGAFDDASRFIANARALAAIAGAGAESEVGAAIARLARMLAAPG